MTNMVQAIFKGYLITSMRCNGEYGSSDIQINNGEYGSSDIQVISYNEYEI